MSILLIEFKWRCVYLNQRHTWSISHVNAISFVFFWKEAAFATMRTLGYIMNPWKSWNKASLDGYTHTHTHHTHIWTGLFCVLTVAVNEKFPFRFRWTQTTFALRLRPFCVAFASVLRRVCVRFALRLRWVSVRILCPFALCGRWFCVFVSVCLILSQILKLPNWTQYPCRLR